MMSQKITYEKDEGFSKKKPSFIQRMLSLFTYTQKIGIILSLVAFATLLTSFLLLKAQKEEMFTLKKEMQGLSLQKSIREAFEGIVKHKILSHRYLEGDESIKQEIIELQDVISRNIAELVELTHLLQKDLSLEDKDFELREEQETAPKQLLKQWEDFSTEAFETSPDISDAFHITLIDGLQSLLKTVGDTSKLNFDSELKTHYLTESLLETLPEAQDTIAQILTLLHRITLENKSNYDDQHRLTFLTTVYRNNLNRLQQALNKVIYTEKSEHNNVNVNSNLVTPLNSYIENGKSFVQLIDQFQYALERRRENETEKGLFPFSESNLFGIKALNKSFLLVDALSQHTDRLLQNRYDSIYRFFYRLLLTILGTLLAALLIGFIVAKDLNRYLNGVYESVRQYREGNLNARAPEANDKALQKFTVLLNDLAVRFDSMTEDLEKAGVDLSTSTSQLSEAADYQKESVSQQEKTIQEILQTAIDISLTTQQFAKTTNDISKAAEETSMLASLGAKDLAKMEQTMRQMVQGTENITAKLAVLNEKTSSITSVITTITKVADQTNLLSLNAAIEAEKAGEHGKSFSVIAKEIRRLADQTANATLDIEKMISEMINAVTEGVIGVDKFTEEIRSGVNQVSQVSEKLSTIIEQVGKQALGFENVNQKMQGLSEGALQINNSMELLSETAGKTSLAIHQFSQAIEMLTNLADKMRNLVAKTKKI